VVDFHIEPVFAILYPDWRKPGRRSAARLFIIRGKQNLKFRPILVIGSVDAIDRRDKSR
jgi:hypothetical protein